MMLTYRCHSLSAFAAGVAPLVLISGGLALGADNPPLTTEDVIAVEREWAAGIVEIGKTYQAGGDYKGVAARLLNEMYGYDAGHVLFKPTKAEVDQFRGTREEALSYFVGGIEPEDHGFAIQPWSKVRFENDDIVIDQDSAEAMGNYYFTDANTGREVKVEFTLGIKRAPDSHPVIFLHHSSLPYHAEH